MSTSFTEINSSYSSTFARKSMPFRSAQSTILRYTLS